MHVRYEPPEAMAVRLNSVPSLLAMAVSHRRVPFVLPRRHSSATDKPRRHSAAAELVNSLPKRSHTMNVINVEGPRGSVVAPACGGDGPAALPPPPLPSSPLLTRMTSSVAGQSRASPRRCDSDPDSCLAHPSSSASPGTSGVKGRHPPRRSNSESHASIGLHTSSSSHSPAPVTPASSRRAPPRRAASEPCRPNPPAMGPNPDPLSAPASTAGCDVLKAYKEAVCFHNRLREEYETSKRVFILFRYRRLRSLIHRATVDRQLDDLRRAIHCKCSCGVYGGGSGSGGGGKAVPGVTEGRVLSLDNLDGMLDDLVSAMRPAFNRLKTCLQSALGHVVSNLLVSSTPTLSAMSSRSSLTSLSLTDPHEWQRSRLVLLERHLERMKRDCLTSQRHALPLRRYRAMKTSLKHVLDARMV